MTALPFGTAWPMHYDALQERAAGEYAAFQSWVFAPGRPPLEERVLTELLSIMPASEFVEGRAACVVETEDLGSRTGLGQSVVDVLDSLELAGLVTSHAAATVFRDQRDGIVVRVRKPDVVLTIEAAGPLWLRDAWTALRPR
jgi:hypothetical protein